MLFQLWIKYFTVHMEPAETLNYSTRLVSVLLLLLLLSVLNAASCNGIKLEENVK